MINSGMKSNKPLFQITIWIGKLIRVMKTSTADCNTSTTPISTKFHPTSSVNQMYPIGSTYNSSHTKPKC